MLRIVHIAFIIVQNFVIASEKSRRFNVKRQTMILKFGFIKLYFQLSSFEIVVTKSMLRSKGFDANTT